MVNGYKYEKYIKFRNQYASLNGFYEMLDNFLIITKCPSLYASKK